MRKKIISGTLLFAMLAGGCGDSGLREDVNEMRAKVKRWNATVNELKAELTEDHKVMDKVHEIDNGLESAKEDMSGLKAEWFGAKNGELVVIRADIQDMQNKWDAVKSELKKMREDMSLINTKLDDLKKKATEDKVSFQS